MNAALKLVSTIALTFSLFQASANHYMGSDIYYECVGANQYQITVNLYHDCQSIAPPVSVTVGIQGCSMSDVVTLSHQTTYTVDQSCFSAPSHCDSGFVTGMRKAVYTGLYTFTSSCSDWTLYHEACCRNQNVSSLTNGASQGHRVEAHLNNLDFACNSGPVFTHDPVAPVCIGQPVCLNVGAIDAENDSLRYSLVDAQVMSANSVTYEPSFSGLNPISTVSGVAIDPLYGDICFTPNVLMGSVFAIKVEQYDRSTGLLIGSAVRDINVFAINCANQSPAAEGFDNNTFQYGVNDMMEACPGSAINVTLGSSEPDLDSVYITAHNVPAGALFTDNLDGTWSLDWTPTLNQFGTHHIALEYRDNHCPFEGVAYATFTFEVSMNGASIQTLSTESGCGVADGSVELIVSPINGTLMVDWDNDGTGDFDDPAQLTGLAAGTYTFDIYDSNDPGCHAMGVVEVVDSSGLYSWSQMVSDETCTGAEDGEIEVVLSGPSVNATYSIAGNSNTTGVFTGLAPGIYQVDVMAGSCALGPIEDTVMAATPLEFTNVTVVENPCQNNTPSSSVVVSTSGGSGAISYLYEDSLGNTVSSSATASQLSAGEYLVTIADAVGCETDSLIDIEHTMPVASFVVDSVSGAYSAYLTNTSTDADDYIWLVDTVATATSDIMFSPVVNFADTVSICLVAVTSTGCADSTCTILMMPNVSRLVESSEFGLKLYPIPVEDVLNVQGLKVGDELMLIDAQGRVVRRLEVGRECERLDLSHLDQGLYYLHAHNEVYPVLVR